MLTDIRILMITLIGTIVINNFFISGLYLSKKEKIIFMILLILVIITSVYARIVIYLLLYNVRFLL